MYVKDYKYKNASENYPAILPLSLYALKHTLAPFFYISLHSKE